MSNARKKPLHILLVDNNNLRGGTPALTCALANAMCARGHTVTLLLQKPVSRFLYPLYKLKYMLQAAALGQGKHPMLPRGCVSLSHLYPLSSKINVKTYTFSDKNLHVQSLRTRIRAWNVDVCLPLFGDARQLVWAVTLLGSGIPYIYTELCAPRIVEEEFWSPKGRLAAMSGADQIHMLLPAYKKSVPDFLQTRVRCIPLPAPRPSSGSALPEGEQGKPLRILWLGRFDDSIKQWQMTMRAFALLSPRYPQWELHMVGTGAEFSHAKRICATSPGAARIFLHGNVPDTAPFYQAAHIFCISSRSEGLPTTVLEAFAFGLPVAGFAECDGVRGIVQHGKNGLLASKMTSVDLAETLSQLMAAPALRARMGEEAMRSCAAFDHDAVMAAWEELFQEAAASKGHTVMDNFAREPFASQARMASVVRREWLYRDFGMPMPDHFLPRIWFIVAFFRKALQWLFQKAPI